MPSLQVEGVDTYQYASGPPNTIRRKSKTPERYADWRRDAQDMEIVYSEWNGRQSAPHHLMRGALLELSVLAPSYSRLSTTIASRGLNCRVRNENGWDPSDEALAQKAQDLLPLHEEQT